MKNLLAITILVLATTRVAHSFAFPDLSPMGYVLMFIYGIFEEAKQQIISPDCNGFCMPGFLGFLCEVPGKEGTCDKTYFISHCCSRLRFFGNLLTDKSDKPGSTCSGQQANNEDLDNFDDFKRAWPPAKCPGRCAWPSGIKNCDAYINVDGLCRYSTQKCCVPRTMYSESHPDIVMVGKDATPTSTKPSEITTARVDTVGSVGITGRITTGDNIGSVTTVGNINTVGSISTVDSVGSVSTVGTATAGPSVDTVAMETSKAKDATTKTPEATIRTTTKA